MIPDILIVFALIAVLSVVQSVFGMGVLVFGTPTLLLMGYDFPSTLGYLLPASFAISVLQVFSSGVGKVKISNYLYLLCLPGIGFGLWLTDASDLMQWVKTMVGVTLIVSALVRFWDPAQILLVSLLKRHFALYHLIMGVVHGLTNLGGALLAVLASGTNDGKEAVRYTVAHYYLSFSVVQMIVLATITGHADLLVDGLPTALVSMTVYQVIGNRIFLKTQKSFYNVSLAVFMASYGLIVLLR